MGRKKGRRRRKKKKKIEGWRTMRRRTGRMWRGKRIQGQNGERGIGGPGGRGRGEEGKN